MLSSVVVLDAAMTVAEARARLAAQPADAPVVVRAQVELELAFHRFRAGPLFDRLAHSDTGNAAIHAVLELDGRDGAPVIQLADATRGRLADFDGVVLDGAAIVGVSARRPRRTAAAAAPAPSGDAAPTVLSRGGGRRIVIQPRERPRTFRSARGHGGAEPSGAAPDVPDAGPLLEAAPAPAAEPLRWTAHTRLDLASDVVAPGEAFELGIGLAAEAQPGVSGGALAATLPAGTEAFDLDVQLVADGFESPSGWHFRMRVDVAAPERAMLRIRLVAPADGITRLSLLEVHFSYGGVPAGVAFRRIAVQPADRASAGIAAGDASHTVHWAGAGAAYGAAASAAGGAALRIDASEPPPDLTITISKPDGNEASGRYHWSFTSPHDVALPREPVPIDLGEDARTFAGRMIQLVTRAEGTPLIDQALNAIGRQVHDEAPPMLDAVLRAVWHAARAGGDRVPTVLLHSAEPHVPWELALLEDPPDAAAPAFFGAQFAIGRWILGPRGVRVPPPREVVVRAMAVVAGDYRSSLHLRPLPHAEAEGLELERRWNAVRLAATIDGMDRLLEGKLERDGAPVGGAEAIHFACHGEVDPRNPRDAMIFLDDDWPLDPSLFLHAPVGRSHTPFLFLNACQVGQAGEVLGEYAGFAGSCLRAGFRGFVAPLWSVSDDVAQTIALEFYERAFGGDDVGGGGGAGGAGGARGAAGAAEPVAAILTSLRGRYPAAERVPASTWLAYVFYGHPAFRLRRVEE